MISKFAAIKAYRAALLPGRTRAAMLARQETSIARWLAKDVPRVAAYHGFSGKLRDLPIIDKSTVMARFADYNCAGITAEMGWAAFAGAKRVGDYTVGASTGTSGNRGLFVISDTERYRWLGTILAKALPGFWRQRHRVAVILPLNTPLYDSANQSRLLRLRFFDIHEGPESWINTLADFDPTIIIAPPKILTWLADQDQRLAPARVFSAAETCDPIDQTLIEARFGTPMGQIYMATEGLFAVSCAHGALHLCEDTMHFELPTVGEHADVRELIISDFSRDTQIMARYRMNDLIRLGSACACGSPLQTVAEVIGRKDDCFEIGASKVLFTPDVLRNAVIGSDRQISDFRVHQIASDRVTLLMPPETPQQMGMNAQAALQAVFAQRGVGPKVDLKIAPLAQTNATKRRRIENTMPIDN